jgi:hypothetical protein
LVALAVVLFKASALLLLTSLFGYAALRISARFTPCFLLIRGLRSDFLVVATPFLMRPVPPRPHRYAPAFGEEEKREERRRERYLGGYVKGFLATLSALFVWLLASGRSHG